MAVSSQHSVGLEESAADEMLRVEFVLKSRLNDEDEDAEMLPSPERLIFTEELDDEEEESIPSSDSTEFTKTADKKNNKNVPGSSSREV